MSQWVSTRQSGSLKHGSVLVEHTNAQNTKDMPTCKVGGLTHIAAAFEKKKSS